MLGIGIGVSDAQAYDAAVDASVNAQFYTLSSPYGDPLIRRRRYTQTLGLSVLNLQGDYVPGGPELSIRGRVRLDADLGQQNAERDVNNQGRFIPGLERAPVDLMYLYVEGNNYLDGHLGFKVGRQYVTDVLGWWSFDGGLARITTPAYVAFEGYGGLEQRGGLPMLSTSRFSADGVFRGDRTGFDANDWTSFQDESQIAPAWGVAAETTGLHWLSARATYRKVINQDTVYVSPFADPGGGFTTVAGSRVSTERAGLSARLGDRDLGAVTGSAVYDLYNQLVSEYAGSLEWYATDQLTLGANYDYFLPTFDADSIWNWFTHNGMTTATGRVAWNINRQLGVQASGGVRLFKTEGDPDEYGAQQLDPNATPDRTTTGQLLDGLGTVSGSYRYGDGNVTLRGMGESGDRGHRVGADITQQQFYDAKHYDTKLIVSLYDWSDGLRPDRDATSFSYVVGGGVLPSNWTRFGIEWEHATNRLVGQRYRVLATVDLTVLK